MLNSDWKKEILANEEKYQDLIINDLYYSIQGIVPDRLFPIKYGNIPSIKKFFVIKKSNDPFKFHVIVKLKNLKESFIAVKYDKWRTHWAFEYRGEFVNDSSDLKRKIQEHLLTPLQNFALHVKGHDFTYDYSDDYSVYARGRGHENYIRKLYARLPIKVQNKAYEIWKKESHNQKMSFEDFQGFMASTIKKS